MTITKESMTIPRRHLVVFDFPDSWRVGQLYRKHILSILGQFYELLVLTVVVWLLEWDSVHHTAKNYFLILRKYFSF